MKKAEKIILIIFMVFFAGIFSFSQEKLTLTLEESLRLALSQNPYQLAAEERVEAAKSRVNESVAVFFPSLNAQGIHTLDEKAMELEFPSLIPGQPPQKIKVDFTRDYQFSLSLSFPLFTGGRLISGYKQARYNLLSTQESARQSENSTIFNTKKAFYGYLLTRDFVKVAREAVEVAEKHYKNVKNLYEVGMASKFDLLRSEVQVANLKPQMIRATNALKVAELSLKTILGLDLSTPIEIKGELAYEPFTPDLQECIAKALQNRPEISQLGYQRQVAREMVKIARAADLPSIAIAGNYNFWADKFNFKKNNWTDYYSINLVMTIPIFNGFANSARAAQSMAMIREIELTHKGVEDMVMFEIRQAILKIEEAMESLQSQEKNVEQATESLRIAELNYSEGLATTLDVSAAQAALSQAKTNYSQALYDYVIAKAELDKATGIGWVDK